MQAPLAAPIAALLLAGCATTSPPGPQPPPAAATARADPLEPFNRALFGVGRVLDRLVARPVAMTYRRVLPRPLRRGVRNVLQNLDEPLVAMNDLLQAHPGAGVRTLARFATNSTIGLGGLMDPATRAGLPHHDNGFGATLGRYGVPDGPYLFLPLIGPSSVRDALGGGVDYLTDPISAARYSGARTVGAARPGLSLIDDRTQAERDIQTLFNGAADPYAQARSVYLQTRAAAKGGEPALEDLPDLPATPEAPQPTPEPNAPPAGPARP